MTTSAIAVFLIFATAFLVLGIEVWHQKRTTGAIDLKLARRWFYGTVGAALALLLGLAIIDFSDYSRSREALFDAQSGAEAVQRHDPDMAITLFNKALGAGTLHADTEVEVLKARGMAYLQKEDWDMAAADFNAVLKRKPDDPEADLDLGAAYLSKGDNEAALRRFDEVVTQNRGSADMRAEAFAMRGSARVMLGQYQSGIEDFDEALRRQPKNYSALGGRGQAYFYLGTFDKAAADLAAAADQDMKWAYHPLWLYLALTHQGKDGKAELERRAGNIDLKSWPGPVIEFYRDRIGIDDVLAAAHAGDAKAQRGQLCEANFYLGEHALLAGDKGEAARLLGAAVDGCDHRFVEYPAAKTELARAAP
jgi:lipoprotein NlpI